MHYKYPEEASYNPADKDCVSLEEAYADYDRCTDCNGHIPVPGVCKDCFMARYKPTDPLEAEKELLEKLTSFEDACKNDPNDKPPKLYILED